MTTKFVKLLALALTVSLLAILGACSFQPLHGKHGTLQSAHSLLSATTIKPVASNYKANNAVGRTGQMLRNELIFRFTGGNYAQPAQYQLNIKLKERAHSSLVDLDDDATSKTYSATAYFTLTRLSTKEVVLKGKALSQAAYTYDISSTYSDVRARLDARKRVSLTLAEDITTRLAAFYSETE